MDCVVDFTYNEPRWSDVTITGVKDIDEAKDIAMDQIEVIYPEAIDIEILEVREVKNAE